MKLTLNKSVLKVLTDTQSNVAAGGAAGPAGPASDDYTRYYCTDFEQCSPISAGGFCVTKPQGGCPR